MPHPHLPRPTLRVIARVAAGLLLLAMIVPSGAAAAGDGLSMQARALLQGHVRQGGWFAIAVDLENAGPAITGELRVAAGADSKTRFGTPVELATGSRKTYLLYAQPPSFGGNLTVQLLEGTRVIAESKVAIALHSGTQLVAGVVAENPARLVAELSLAPGPTGVQPVIATLSAGDLPERIQAWAPLDALIWQDTDTAQLTPAQLDCLRGWVSGGGRLVIVGGTAGADSLSALPDDLLPYRPDAVLDIDPLVLRPVLGGVPDGASTLTAYAGPSGSGRVLASSGDRVVAADLQVGTGSVTLLGFDPTTAWLADSDTWDTPLWRRLVPTRTAGPVTLADDSQIVSAVINLPSLALPPIGGLLVLLFGYVVLVGPVNYVVLRRIDRREWAWVTVPVLIAVFTVGSFGIGGLLRGTDVIVHEVGVVSGAPGTTSATVRSYLGVFSPSRSSYQVKVDGDALLAAPINGDIFGTGTTTALDVLQGDPSRIRDLDVGYGSIRTIRAEASATGPQVTASLVLSDGRLEGQITNESAMTLESAAIVVGTSAQRLGDIAPGATATIDLRVALNVVNWDSMSDRIFGSFNWDASRFDDASQRTLVRRSVIDQLSVDPMTGFPNALAGDGAMLVAWGQGPVVPLELEGHTVRRMSNILYEVPFTYAVRGKAVFASDLLRVSVLEIGANFFSKDPMSLNLGSGSARVSYRPVPFEGRFTPSKVTISMGFGGDAAMPGEAARTLKETTRCEPGADGCVIARDGIPDLEALDVRSGAWVQFEHLSQGIAYELADPSRWIEPQTGELQLRFVNESTDQVYFQPLVKLEGTVQ